MSYIKTAPSGSLHYPLRAEDREAIREHLRVAPIFTRLRNGSTSLETVNKHPSTARYFRFFWSESKQDNEYIRAPPPDPRAVAKSMLQSKGATARRIPVLPEKPKASRKPNLPPRKETRLGTPSSEAQSIDMMPRVKGRSQNSPTSSSHRPKGSVGLVLSVLAKPLKPSKKKQTIIRGE